MAAALRVSAGDTDAWAFASEDGDAVGVCEGEGFGALYAGAEFEGWSRTGWGWGEVGDVFEGVGPE